MSLPVCRRHGIATSMAFRWSEEFGLTARKAPPTGDGRARRRHGAGVASTRGLAAMIRLA